MDSVDAVDVVDDVIGCVTGRGTGITEITEDVDACWEVV